MNTAIAINAPTFVMNIASLLSKLLGLYSYAIIIRVLLSWLPQQNPYQQDRPVYSFLCKITDPYMNFFRSRKFTMGRVDYSPLLALMVLNIAKSALQIVGVYGKISLALIVALIIQNIWSYLFSYVLFIIVAVLGVRWFLGRNPYKGNNQQIIYTLDSFIQKPVNFVFRLFYKNRQVADQKLVGVSFVFYLVIYLGAKYGFRELIN